MVMIIVLQLSLHIQQFTDLYQLAIVQCTVGRSEKGKFWPKQLGIGITKLSISHTKRLKKIEMPSRSAHFD